MANILKCKMCGGDIEVSQDMTIGKCLFCGSTMTLPRIDSDKKARLFNRANEYRLNNEFDKAYDAYKTIAEEDSQEAEAYWGMVLSEYGVEYVEDPKTGKRIPTCHRTRLQPITSSVDYKQAIQCADAERKFAYQDEAEQLNKIQKEIMAISSKEEPYSVFICYKETDDISGERTKDSVLAQDIYDTLTAKGVRTFFARISLEDKLGQNYEPFIFSALSSAKVMIHVTTSAENSDAVWVKNEWSRYIDFMSEDKSKSLIPVYLDMSPYELPDQMQKLQAQDMSKVGAIQDLVRGIQKLVGDSEIQLSADQKVLQALVKERKEQEAELKRKEAAQEKREQERQQRFEKSVLFWKKNRVKFIVALVVILIVTIAIIIFVPMLIYNSACRKLERGDYETAYTTFEKMGNYRDSKVNMNKAEKGIKEMMAIAEYQNVISLIDNKEFDSAIERFTSLNNDSEIKNSVNNSAEVKEMYNEACYQVASVLNESGETKQSISFFQKIEDYKDSKERIQIIKDKEKYDIALKTYKEKSKQEDALKTMKELSDNDFLDSKNQFNIMLEDCYKDAVYLMEMENYDEAMERLSLIMKYSYSDSRDKYNECVKQIEEKKKLEEEMQAAYYKKISVIEGCWHNPFADIKFDVTKNNNKIKWYQKAGEKWEQRGDVTYDEEKGTFHFVWMRNYSFTATVNGNTMKVTGDQAETNTSLARTYTKVIN